MADTLGLAGKNSGSYGKVWRGFAANRIGPWTGYVGSCWTGAMSASGQKRTYQSCEYYARLKPITGHTETAPVTAAISQKRKWRQLDNPDAGVRPMSLCLTAQPQLSPRPPQCRTFFASNRTSLYARVRNRPGELMPLFPALGGAR